MRIAHKGEVVPGLNTSSSKKLPSSYILSDTL